MPGPKPTYTERLQILLDPPLRAALDAYTAQNHTKAAQVIRAALREYLASSNKVAARVTVPESEGRKSSTPRTQQEQMDDFYRANMAKGKK